MSENLSTRSLYNKMSFLLTPQNETQDLPYTPAFFFIFASGTAKQSARDILFVALNSLRLRGSLHS